jgi:hypothetical protein
MKMLHPFRKTEPVYASLDRADLLNRFWRPAPPSPWEKAVPGKAARASVSPWTRRSPVCHVRNVRRLRGRGESQVGGRMSKRPETVTCKECGKQVLGRTALGIGPMHRAVWICTECITDDSMDRVFAPIGQKISKATEKEQS